jgi:hypothetical protein
LYAPLDGHGQARRDPVLQPVSAVKARTILLGAGLAWGSDRSFPLSGLEGNLLSIGRLSLAYALADRVLLEIRGDVWQTLWVDEADPPPIPLDSDAQDGRTGDVGDFRIGLLLAPIGGERGFSAGAHVEVKLPNSNEAKGIGSNTTDVRLALLGSYGAPRWRATVSLGVGILEAPVESFEQNDVFLYAGELLYRVGSGLRLALGLEGRASTRDRVPLGTEDLGEVVIGADYRLGSWLLDVGLTRGLVEDSSEWGVRAGWAYAAGGP